MTALRSLCVLGALSLMWTAALVPVTARADNACVPDAVLDKWNSCPAATAGSRSAPSSDRIAQAKSLSLCAQKDWKGCGAAYDRIYDDDSSGSFAKTAARESVVAWAHVYRDARADGRDRQGAGGLPGERKKKAEPVSDGPKALDDDAGAMLAAFARYACVAKPDASSSADEKTLYAEALYARARIMFEARRWEEAAIGFRQVALQHASEEVGVFAGQLYLEALNMLGSRSEPPRAACFTDMASDVPKLRELYCAGTGTSTNEEPCAVLLRIQRDIERLEAERIFEAANAEVGAGRARAKFIEAGERYLALWETYNQGPCEKAKRGTDDGCARSEEVLANAASAFQAGHDVSRAIAVRKILLDPKYHLAQTELGRVAVYRIASNYRALLSFDEAASWYERFVDENPKASGPEGSPADVLSDAIALRLALGQVDRATKDADIFAKLFSKSSGAAVATNWCAIGRFLVTHEDWAAAEKALGAAMAAVDRDAPLDRAGVAHADLARASAKLGHGDAAKREYEKVRASAKNADAVDEQLAKQMNDDDRLGEIAARRSAFDDACAEAAFYFADAARAAALTESFPTYSGPNEADHVRAWVDSEVPTFIEKRKRALGGVVDAYLAIAKARFDRPTAWATLAAARVFDIKVRMYSDIVASPYPAAWRTAGPSDVTSVDGPALRSAYRDRLIARTLSLDAELLADATECVFRGNERLSPRSEMRSCEAWLASHDPDFHPVDEIVDRATRVGIGTSELPQLLDRNGDPALPPDH